MAVPRPLLLALLGTVLLAATFLATRNARDQAADSGSQPASQQAAAPQPAPDAAPKTKPGTDKAAPAKPGTDKTAPAKPGADKAAPAKPRADKAAPRAEKRSPAGKAAKRRQGPAAVMRAIADKRLVVLFFYQRGASDDRRVARSVAALRGRTKAAVFTDRIANLGRYGQIATSVGVTRAPSIVIIGKGRRGRLIEGYVDPDTLAQRVADAR
jgi:hypothetical protein